MLIIGNKTDLKRLVEKEEAMKFAQDNDFLYFETQAKKGKGVAIAYDAMVRKVISDTFKQDCQTKGSGIPLTPSNNNSGEKRKCGC